MIRFIVFNSINGRARERLHLNKPLLGYSRLNRCVATVASADIMAVILNFNKSTFSFEIGNDSFSRFVSVHSGIFRIIINNFCIGCHHIDNRKIMAKTDFKVVRIVSRRDFNDTCSEFDINIIIRNNRDFTVNDRKNNFLAYIFFISFIIGINCDCSITEESFRSCCGKIQIFITVRKLISQMPEMSCLILIFNLCIGN